MLLGLMTEVSVGLMQDIRILPRQNLYEFLLHWYRLGDKLLIFASKTSDCQDTCSKVWGFDVPRVYHKLNNYPSHQYWLWIMFESYIPLSRQFLRESLSITNATIPVTSDRSFDLITYGLTEDWLINWTVSYVKRLCFSRSPLKDPTSCADSTDVTINFSSWELKKQEFVLNFFREYRK